MVPNKYEAQTQYRVLNEKLKELKEETEKKKELKEETEEELQKETTYDCINIVVYCYSAWGKFLWGLHIAPIEVAVDL